MHSISALINQLSSTFEQHNNPQDALLMQKYMKDHFIFYGIKSTQRSALTTPIIQANANLIKHNVIDILLQLWLCKHREMQYVGLDLLKKHTKLLQPEDINHIEYLITHRSWWDTVDMIASTVIGHLCKVSPFVRDEVMPRWAESDNMWLQRSTIIYQLKYKSNTDTDLLATYILSHDTSKEFFIRKAQGWALRQYSAYNPTWVINFVEANPQLSNLTKREALRKL